MEALVKLIVVGAFIGLIWYALQPRYVFLVRIGTGTPRLTQGKLTAAFIQVIAETCERNGVRDGWIGGVGGSRGVSLAFSRSIPPPCRQQLRNLWVMHR